MHKKFLTGVVVGMVVMFVLLSGIAKYDELSRRLGFVEGYIQQLDKSRRRPNHVLPQSGLVRVRA